MRLSELIVALQTAFQTHGDLVVGRRDSEWEYENIDQVEIKDCTRSISFTIDGAKVGDKVVVL